MEKKGGPTYRKELFELKQKLFLGIKLQCIDSVSMSFSKREFDSL